MNASAFSSRRIHAALQIGLLLLLGAGLTLGTGCSWHKKKTPGQISDLNNGAGTPDPNGSGNPAGGPPDSRPETQIGSLTPFTELSVIYFDYDQATIRPDQTRKAEGNLQYLATHPNDKVMIEGHCDERGTAEYNLALGERRAAAVRDYYLQGGIAAERIAVSSKGSEEPAVPGKSEAAWAKNRRCEFKRMN
jgi:peptidoglycan-associated lipoprotein